MIDVCAAPGGKATELGSRIGEGGMLLANDISNSRGEGAAAQPGNPGSGTSSRDERGSGKISNLVSGLFLTRSFLTRRALGEGMFRKRELNAALLQ